MPMPILCVSTDVEQIVIVPIQHRDLPMKLVCRSLRQLSDLGRMPNTIRSDRNVHPGSCDGATLDILFRMAPQQIQNDPERLRNRHYKPPRRVSRDRMGEG